MIGIIDYDSGNLGSVVNACAFLDIEAKVLKSPAEMDQCRAVLLPGQGMFGDCMGNLERFGFADPVKAWVGAGKPFLGICVGVQILFDGSDESPDVPGLGLLPGRVHKFELEAEFKVPQMGWNRVRQVQPDCPLFVDVPDDSHFYFVHSYYVDPADRAVTAGATAYGHDYTSIVWKDNLMAVQFHPEKSQQVGLQLLGNFARWALK